MSCVTMMMRIGIEDRFKRENKCSSSCDDCDEGEDGDDDGVDDAHADLIVWHVIIIITMYMLILERSTSLLRKVLWKNC